jgi:tetratricopeptide (TPR) repeat protein
VKKIKIRAEEKKIVGKEFNPIEFFNTYKTRIIRFGVSIVVVILCLSALWIWQGNKRANIPILLSQARELFSVGKYEASLSVYKQLQEHPIALLGIAYCYEELGNIEEAKKIFLEIKDKFPDSPWSEEAIKGAERLG